MTNNSTKISLQQYLFLLSVGVMPPLLKLVPSAEAETAGRAGWLTPLAALPFALLGVWLVTAAGKHLPEAYGMGDALCLWLGQPVGRFLCFAYGIIMLLFAATELRFCAERFTSTIYPETGITLFFVVILALDWYLCRRKLAVTARAGQLFFYVMLLTMAVVLLLGMGSIRLYHVFPIWTQDIFPIFQATPTVLGAMSAGIGWLFLFDEVTERHSGRRRGMLWAVYTCLLMTLLGFVVLGVFGEGLTVRLQIPFFSLAKEIQVGSVVQRVEPLVVTMWVFADIISTTLLLRGAEKAFCCAAHHQIRLGNWLILLVFPLSYLIADSFFALDRLYMTLFLPLEWVMFIVLPLFAAGIGVFRRKKPCNYSQKEV